MEKIKKEKQPCLHCGKSYVDTSYYNSNSMFYRNGKIPYCKHCIEKFYHHFFMKYKQEGCLTPEKKAVKRLCMVLDVYYRDDAFNSSFKRYNEDDVDTTPISQYMRVIQLYQYNRNKETYEDTLAKEKNKETTAAATVNEDIDYEIEESTVDFFGAGFSKEDYVFLKKEYDDWTARHECKTKAQEEVFKDICFNRLQNLKALRAGEDTKDITASFQKLLDSGKLQPKQNIGDTTADNQTFGTLLDKYENERPLPEIDEELKDVDKIGYYIDTFFKGHTCRMLNVKNAFSNLYSSMMRKFTVNKPEYNLDEENYDSEINFDAIFGDKPSDSPDD